MLRVGLTGGLGSGKSTAAAIFRTLGAHVLNADEIGRELMQPGNAVFDAIVERFGRGVVKADGELDRPALARLAFAGGRVEELNAIVHPAVIAEQARVAAGVFERERAAVVIVESALIFETAYGEKNGIETHDSGSSWRSRFDRLILVAAPEELKIARFVARSGGETATVERRRELEEEARRRLDRQIPDERKAGLCDYVLTNGGAVGELEWQIDQLWPILVADSMSRT